MTDKEILAELKLSYEKLYDIRENGCADHCSGQLTDDLIKKLEIAKSNIEDIYSEFYKTLDKNSLRVKSLEDDEKVYIASNADGDYEVGNDLYDMSCADANYYWYEDNDFLDNEELDYEDDAKNKYYVKIWTTEEDREQGFADNYYKNFNSLKEAIEEMRVYFYEGNCVCAEIYFNDEIVYNCDKDSEIFYAGTYNIIKVSENKIIQYINCWSHKKPLPTNEWLLYCEHNNKTYTAIDNRSGYCFVEDFSDEENAFKWLLNIYEEENEL